MSKKTPVRVCFAVGIIGLSIAIFMPFFSKPPSYSKVCVDGVSYILFRSGPAAVQHDKNGAIKTCNP